MNAATVIEIKHRYSRPAERHTSGVERLHVGTSAILRHEVAQAFVVEGTETVVHAGTTALVHFWTCRPYNACVFTDRSGSLIGCFFNLSADTRITATVVEWWDLWIDYWVAPDGHALLLDENEVPYDLDEATANRVVVAKRQLLSEGTDVARSLMSERRLS